MPLEGQRVLVTRPIRQSGSLRAALASAGAEPVVIPTIRIESPPDLRPLRAAAASLDGFDWVILTSANAVERLAAAVREVTGEFSALQRARLAVIGPATREAARVFGCEPAVMSPVHRGEALAEAVLDAGAGEPGTRVLLPRALEARPALPTRLRAAGVRVADVPAYVTTTEEASADALSRLVDRREADWVTFTAASAARGYVELVGSRTGGARVAAIGPITAQAVRDGGLGDPMVATSYTTAGLVEALVRVVTGRGDDGSTSVDPDPGQ